MLCAFPQGGIAHVGVEGLGSLFPGHGTYGGGISRGDCADDVVGKIAAFGNGRGIQIPANAGGYGGRKAADAAAGRLSTLPVCLGVGGGSADGTVCDLPADHPCKAACHEPARAAGGSG